MSNTVIKGWTVARATHLSWRSIAVAVAATLMLLAGCGSDDSTPATASPTDSASTSATSEAPASSEPSAASPLEDTWQAGPVSLKKTEATVRRHGLGRWIEDYRANAPFPMVARSPVADSYRWQRSDR